MIGFVLSAAELRLFLRRFAEALSSQFQVVSIIFGWNERMLILASWVPEVRLNVGRSSICKDRSERRLVKDNEDKII